MGPSTTAAPPAAYGCPFVGVFLNPCVTSAPGASTAGLSCLSHALEGISGFLKPGLGAQRAVT